MKIGAFAKKHEINPSAVRFYIDKALLTPKRENGQYVFDETNSEQMKKILKYKSYRFTLEEIELLFYFENHSNLKDGRIIDEIINILKQKKDLVEQEIVSLTDVTKNIDEEINYFNGFKERSAQTRSTYVPLAAIRILRCPQCGEFLHLENAAVEAEGIREASVNCQCGYSARIEDGILRCPESTDESPFKLYENVDSVLAMASDVSPAFRGLMEKGHLRMYQQILHNCKACRYVLAGPLTYNFILGYLNFMSDETTVVVVDLSLNKLKRMKEYLSDSGRNILFIAGDINKAPLRKGIMDLFIDDFSFCNYSVTYNKNLFEIIAPFLKDRGKLVGQFIDYSKAPKSLRNIKTDHPEFEPELLTLKKIYASMADAGLKILERTNLGSPEGKEKDFKRQVGDEKIALVTYIAEK